MDIRVLKYFVTIADTQGITSAAKKLNMTQPPLSTQLKALEDELGFPLLTREGKSFYLTAEGTLLYHHANKILADFDSVNQLFSDMRNGITGTLDIGSVRLPNLLIIPDVSARFLRDNPNVAFNLSEGKSWDLKKKLDEEKLEMAFIQTSLDRKQYYSLNVEPLLCTDGKPALQVVFRPDLFPQLMSEAICFEDVFALPLIVHRYQKEALLEMCKRRKQRPNIVCTNSDLFSSLRWAQNGLGVALMLNNVSGLIETMDFSSTLETRQLPDIDFAPEPHCLIWRKDRPLSTVATRFISQVRKSVEEALPLSDGCPAEPEE